METTRKTLEHHLNCFHNGDLEGLLSDYTETSILEIPQTQLRGIDKLRKAFSIMLLEFSKSEMKFEVERTSISGDYAYIFWNAQTEDNNYHAGSDTFIIKDGKIIYQTFSAYVTPRK